MEAIVGPAPRPRSAVLRTLRRPSDGTVLDRALALWLPGPGSYTGEDSAEFHVHGGSAVVEGLTEALLELGLRMAEPGEFTRRAFENGKLDLTQAEAVADLVDAETEAQRRQALAQLDGDLARRHAAWRSTMVEALAVLEAAVDFPDEDVPETVADEAAPALSDVIAALDNAIFDATRGERIRDGYRIALIGAPNAGKSSLLNALARRDAAIVTAIPGTTRDVVAVTLNWAGFRVVVSDTAGLRPTEDLVEIEGVRRARAEAEKASLRLWVVDGSAQDAQLDGIGDAVQAEDVCVINKCDLGLGPAAASARDRAESRGLSCAVASMATGEGVDDLEARLTARVVSALSGAEFPAATQVRHRLRLVEAREHLKRALDALSHPIHVELAAEDVRLSARSLARIAGRIDPEDVLDRVFARFCIGK